MTAIFFTDVDGTLIDQNSYCYEDSLKGLALLKEKSVPLVLVSSKTFEEMIFFMKKLDLHNPFAFENGSGIAYPADDGENFRIELTGPGVDELINFLPNIETITGKKMRGINLFSDEEISDFTGLDLHSASLAKKRMTTLPFVMDDEETLLSDSEINEINIVLNKYNLSITRGGRFNHLIPADTGKGFAVKKIIEFYRDKFNDETVSAAAGDSLNDIPMLESVDYSYVIRKPDGSFINFMNGKIMNSTGPAGFSEAVSDFLKITAG